MNLKCNRNKFHTKQSIHVGCECESNYVFESLTFFFVLNNFNTSTIEMSRIHYILPSGQSFPWQKPTHLFFLFYSFYFFFSFFFLLISSQFILLLIFISIREKNCYISNKLLHACTYKGRIETDGDVTAHIFSIVTVNQAYVWN